MSLEYYLEHISNKILGEHQKQGLVNDGQVEQPLSAAVSVALTYQQIQKMHSSGYFKNETYQRLVSSCMDAIAFNGWRYLEDDPITQRIGVIDGSRAMFAGFDARFVAGVFEGNVFEGENTRVRGINIGDLHRYVYNEEFVKLGPLKGLMRKVNKVLGFNQAMGIDFNKEDQRFRAEFINPEFNVRPPKVERPQPPKPVESPKPFEKAAKTRVINNEIRLKVLDELLSDPNTPYSKICLILGADKSAPDIRPGMVADMIVEAIRMVESRRNSGYHTGWARNNLISKTRGFMNENGVEDYPGLKQFFLSRFEAQLPDSMPDDRPSVTSEVTEDTTQVLEAATAEVTNSVNVLVTEVEPIAPQITSTLSELRDAWEAAEKITAEAIESVSKGEVVREIANRINGGSDNLTDTRDEGQEDTGSDTNETSGDESQDTPTPDENILPNRLSVALGAAISSGVEKIGGKYLSSSQRQIIGQIGMDLWRGADEETRSFMKQGSMLAVKEWTDNRIAALQALKYSMTNGRELQVPAELFELPVAYIDEILKTLGVDIPTSPNVPQVPEIDDVRVTRDRLKAEAAERSALENRDVVVRPVGLRSHLETLQPQIIETERVKKVREIARKLGKKEAGLKRVAGEPEDQMFAESLADELLAVLDRGESDYTVSKTYAYWGITRDELAKVVGADVIYKSSNHPVTLTDVIKTKYLREFSRRYQRALIVANIGDAKENTNKARDGLIEMLRDFSFDDAKIRRTILDIKYQPPTQTGMELLIRFL